MKMDNGRMLVIGAGVNGSICATSLHNAGIDVTVLARGKRYEEVRDEGIVIEDPFKNNKRSVTKVQVINRLDPDDLYDYVLVVVRKNQVADLMPVLAQNRSPNIVFMTNNLAGPEELTRALGKDRVMMGFVFAGGKRDGDVIRAISGMGGSKISSPFGEIDGRITPRLTRLIGILRHAGLSAKPSTDITDYLATHAALVAPIGALIIKHGCDTYALSRSTADLRLLVDAWRETLTVLRATGFRISPPATNLIRIIPRFVLVAAMRKLFSTKFAEVGAGWHCSQAPDEMRQLAMELRALANQAGLPVPAIRKVLGQD
ncbi:MAG TPA: 2-dehydropantoate 2-reductase N-terminal domain-containing protein [Terriglobia bacterium]|nr:2-dehydropantoate 2-reductase N-terminal domain-containing protein [Terriglobia bacterium]